VPSLLDLLYRHELYRRWCDSCRAVNGLHAGDVPDEQLLDVLLAVDLETVQPEEMAGSVGQVIERMGPLGAGRALRQLTALRAAVMACAPEGANLAGFHTFVDLIMAELAGSTIERLKQEAVTDPLTRLANRRRLLEDLRREIARAERSGQPLTLMVIDVDHLKETNDTEGHAAGDRRLVDLADRLRATLRQGDAAYRVGGDEFVLVLPDTRPAALAGGGMDGEPAVVKRLTDEPGPGFSWGLACYPADGVDPDTLLRAADSRLIRTRQRSRRPSEYPVT